MAEGRLHEIDPSGSRNKREQDEDRKIKLDGRYKEGRK